MSESNNSKQKTNSKSTLTREEEKAKRREEKLLDKQRIAEEKKADREAFFKVEDPIGFMRIINIISVVFVVIALFLGIRYIINFSYVMSYNKGTYHVKAEEFLSKLNIPEGYVPHYNAGNGYYMKEDYDSAISSYKAALEAHPTEKKECDIRVNLALAMLHKIDFDHIETEKQKGNAVRQLQSARNVLVEKGCADPYGTEGHDPEAEQLKQDIDKMLEELDAEPEPPESNQNQEQQENGGGQGEEEKQKSRREQQLEKDLQKQQKDAMKERRESDQKQYQQSSGDKKESGSGMGQESPEDESRKNW